MNDTVYTHNDLMALPLDTEEQLDAAFPLIVSYCAALNDAIDNLPEVATLAQAIRLMDMQAAVCKRWFDAQRNLTLSQKLDQHLNQKITL